MIRKLITITFAVLFSCSMGMSQYAYRVRPLPALPASCNPLNGDVVYLTAGAGVSPGLYTCTATDTWRTAGFVGNQNVWNQGTLTASTPVISHTATWNNGAVTFNDLLFNITDTASTAASTFAVWQLAGVTKALLIKDGSFQTVAGVQVGASSPLAFSGRSRIFSSTDGRVNLTDSTGTTGASFTIGPESVAFSRITTNSVGGQAQGVIIQRGDGTNQTFANLGAASNGVMIYCQDCTIANPCAGGGTGAIAKRLNGVWVCN